MHLTLRVMCENIKQFNEEIAGILTILFLYHNSKNKRNFKNRFKKNTVSDQSIFFGGAAPKRSEQLYYP